jgi:peptidoglycan/xylan/chitin deacetylase (PgdA/CDA1 family)
MKIKRKTRNIICYILSYYLIFSGKLKKSLEDLENEGLVLSFYAHNPNRQLFEKCIIWLRNKGFRFISSKELVDIIENKQKIKKAVWLSFDDGWKGNVENVIPILEKYNIPATFFISTKPIEDGYFWWTIAEKYKSLLPISFKDLWSIPENQRKEIIENIVNNIRNKGVEIEREAMTIEDIQRISKNNLVTIGSHTVNHAIIPNCTDVELEYEINNSKKELENWTGKEVKYFSYPNGDFDGREKEILEKYGFELAATTENKFISLESDIYFIPRFSVMNDGSFAENLCHMLGIWQPFISKIKRRLNYSKM